MPDFLTAGSVYAAQTMDLQRVFSGLPEKAQEQVMRPAMKLAATMVAEIERSEAPRESGLLALSLGASSTRTYRSAGSSKLFIAVGVRRGFRSVVAAKKTGGVKVLRRAVAADSGNVRNPAKYLRLVTGGRKAIEAVAHKVLYSSMANRFLGKRVAAAPANPFIDRAFQSSASRIAGRVAETAAPAIAALAAR